MIAQTDQERQWATEMGDCDRSPSVVDFSAKFVTWLCPEHHVEMESRRAAE